MDITVVWFEVVVISAEFIKILEDLPEVSTCKSVTIGDKTIEGPKEVFLAGSMEEVENSLPAIVANLTDRNGCVRIIQRTTYCSTCAEERQKSPEKSIRCTHGLPIINRAWNVDIQKFLESQKVA